MIRASVKNVVNGAVTIGAVSIADCNIEAYSVLSCDMHHRPAMPNNEGQVKPKIEPMHICTAKNSHGDWRIATGDKASSKQERSKPMMILILLSTWCIA